MDLHQAEQIGFLEDFLWFQTVPPFLIGKSLSWQFFL